MDKLTILPREMGALHQPVTGSDVELVVRCQDGDEAAFKTLLDKHKEKAYWLAYDIVNDRDLAVDVIQEAFIRVFQGIGNFNPENSFQAWFYRIVKNLSIDYLRSRVRRPDIFLEEIAEDAAVADDVAATAQLAERRTKVHEIIAMLPLKYRIVLTMRELQGMSFQEISQATSCPSPTVRWRLHKARKLFKELWNKRVDGSA